MKIIIDGKSLTLNQIDNFLHNNCKIEISKEAVKRITRASKLVDEWVKKGETIYGVTTGFGGFSNVRIDKKDIGKLQENLILSHTAGVGNLLPSFIVRLMMLLRINALASGHSGIRLQTLQLLIDMLNNNILPLIPSQGSVGSSGDLAPLAHMVLAMLGKGRVEINDSPLDENKYHKKIMSARSALKKFGLKPVQLNAKEGLALINGTQMMTAYAAYISIEANKLVKIADIAGALSNEALRGTDSAYDLRIHRLRPYKGQIDSASNLQKLLKGSQIRASHKYNDPRVQDAYSLRCIPQVHGASRDAINFISRQVETELNSVTDNPLIFPDKKDYISGGNFHGQPIALAMDFMAIALSELASISERRTDRILNGSLEKLPKFLAHQGGLNSGYMLVQYTAAALVSENKVLAHPASVDSIPTSALKEDHNSMGSISSRKCYDVLQNTTIVLALELLTAAQAIEYHKPLKCGLGTQVAYEIIRKAVPPLKKDRLLKDDIDRVIRLVKEGTILKSVENKIKLN